MAQSARKYQDFMPLEQPRRQPQQPKKVVVKRKRVHYSLVEVFSVTSILVMGLVLALMLIRSSILLYDLNTETREVQAGIELQAQKNNELDAKILELSNPERILDRASKLGLKLDENNVKVIR